MSPHRFKKNLSQNFLQDPIAIQTIVDLVDIQPDDLILEIGPGRGALTKELIKKKATILAIEIDQDLTSFLQSLKDTHPNFNFYIADFRTFTLDTICSRFPIKLVSNLPYHLSGLFIQKICFMHEKIHTATLMVQKEVGERICAKNGKSYGFLSVFIQFFAETKYIATVPKTSFYPIPNVDSAVVQLTFRSPKLESCDLFFSFVKKCFQGKRKILLNCLKPYLDIEVVKKGLLDLNLDENIRAENLSMDQFIALYTYLKNNCLIQ